MSSHNYAYVYNYIRNVLLILYKIIILGTKIFFKSVPVENDIQIPNWRDIITLTEYNIDNIWIF